MALLSSMIFCFPKGGDAANIDLLPCSFSGNTRVLNDTVLQERVAARGSFIRSTAWSINVPCGDPIVDFST